MSASELVAVREIDLLKAEVATLHQLMEVMERTTLEQTAKLQQAAVDLRRQLETTRALTESMGEGVLAFDPEARLSFGNSAAQEMLGWDGAVHAGCALDGLGITPAPETAAMIRTVFEQRVTVREDDAVFVGRDGAALPVSYAASPIVSGDQFLGGVLVFHDISARKRAEEERQRLLEYEREARQQAERSREINQFLADAGSALVSSLDAAPTLERVARLAIPTFADWAFVHLRDGAGNLRRVAAAHADPSKEALFNRVEESYPPSLDDPRGPAKVAHTGQSELVTVISDALLSEAAKDDQHLLNLQRFGFTSYISVPLIARGRTLGAISFAMAESGRNYREGDLLLAQQLADRAALAIDNARLFGEVEEARRDLEKRVRDRTAQLEEANRELESFSYSVSHDLRAPIRHMSGFVDLLRRRVGDSLDATSAHYLQVIVESAKQAGTLVDDLLAFSRMGRAELARQPVSMDNLVHQARADLQAEGAGRTIEWKTGELGEVTGDAAMLRLVWRNLLSNALKYSRGRESTIVEIGRLSEDTEDVFYVRDNGAGFDMRYVGKLFGVFQRLHSGDQFEGTGIGLANVRRIVMRHGGRTWAEGEIDRGATFYFSIPRHDGGQA